MSTIAFSLIGLCDVTAVMKSMFEGQAYAQAIQRAADALTVFGAANPGATGKRVLLNMQHGLACSVDAILANMRRGIDMADAAFASALAGPTTF